MMDTTDKNKDKALRMVIIQRNSNSDNMHLTEYFSERLMRQIKISEQKAVTRKRTRAIVLSTFTAAASILFFMLTKSPHQDIEDTKPTMTQKAEYSMDKTTEPDVTINKKTDNKELIAAEKSSSKKSKQSISNKQTHHNRLPASKENNQLAINNSEKYENESEIAIPKDNVQMLTLTEPHNINASSDDDVCIDCELSDMEAEMTAMISEFEKTTEP